MTFTSLHFTSKVVKKQYFNDIHQDPSRYRGRMRAASHLESCRERRQRVCRAGQVGKERPTGQGQLWRVPAEQVSHGRSQGREVARVTRWGRHTCFSSEAPGAPGCCHLDPRAIAEITPVFPHTLNPSQWMIWAPPRPPLPPTTNANSGRLLALGGFCYELIKLTLSS